jgi:succinate dehydrogenase / fumarate reductase cytochrome b subunit
MVLKRKSGLIRGLTYKGGGPMLAFVLHRLSGLAIVLFVGLHFTAAFFMQQFGNDAATWINIVYENVYFQAFIYFVVIFHGVNGLRIILLDIWPKAIEYQREATWLEWLVIVPVYGLTVFIMIQHYLSGG